MLIGHEKLVKNFKELAEKKALANCYLFFGPPRVGKKLFAASLANFLETGDFEKPKLLIDFLLIEPDAEATIGIDQARYLKSFLWQKPAASARRTAIINDSEAMTAEAQNAILKISEEPPESSLLIIVANDHEKLWPTLQSRLQKIYFSPVPRKLVENWLRDSIDCKADEAKRITEASYGQPGLALLTASNKEFQSLRQSAEKFLKSGFWEHRNIVKAMLEDEKFNLSRFLEALLMVVSKDAAAGKNPDLWHKISSLRRDNESYNVNPRLQLESLLAGD